MFPVGKLVVSLSTHVLCVPCTHRWDTIVYQFGVVSDDVSEVWLSSDHQPAKLKTIHVSCFGCIDPSE